MKNSYDDIINLPHHVSSRHPQMSITDRAAQFSPFAALTCYGDIIRETARLTDAKPELTDAEKNILDEKLQSVLSLPPKERPEISITYFVPDPKKSGGSLTTVTGRIKKVDTARQCLVLADGNVISVDCVTDIQLPSDFSYLF